MNKKKNVSGIDAMRRNANKAEAMLKQLANVNRLMILCHLVKRELTVSDIMQYVDLSQSALSQHLAKMKAQGIVESEKRGKMVFYRIASHEVEAILSTLYLIYCK